MKLRKLRYILTPALLLCALFCAAPSADAVTTEEMQQLLQEMPLELHEYSYSTDSYEVSASMYYSHALLLQDSTTISPDLVKSSLALSVSAYDGEAVSDLLESMDFIPVDNTAVYERSKSGLTVQDCDYAAYTIATAEVTHPLKNDGQDDYIIYCVAIQGTPMNLEWLSDFHLGDGIEHEGFRKASEEIYYAVRDMCKSDNYPSGRTILWLTGHSRGAACANLLASWFQERETYDVPVVKENVVAYTFACPAVSKKADPTMSGIYNFNNPGDLVTMVPLPEWGYGRYGQTIELDTSALGYGNFTTRYASVTGKTYAGTIDDRDYRALLSEIGKSENTQLILDLVAWILGGCNRDVLYEIILKNMPDDPQGFLSILKIAVQEAGYALKVFDLVEFLYTRNEQNAGLISWATINYDTYLDAKPEEFALFLQDNAATIARLEDITGIVITGPQDLQTARIRLETDSNNTLRLQSLIGSAADLICDGEGNIASKVMHAHTQPAYAIWINSMFYGHQGWYENPLVSEVTLDESYFSIGQHCFNNCDALETITIADTVTHAGHYAFYSCDNVTSLTLPADLQYTDAFYGIHTIKTIRYTSGATGIMPDRPSKATYKYMPEYQSSTLQEIIFEEGITHIASHLCVVPSGGSRATLTSVTLPSTLKSIGEEAFRNCIAATFSDWPQSLTTIGTYTFENCDLLKTNPTTLTAFPEGCFHDCDGLTEIVIPDNLTEIGRYAFSSCDNAAALTMPADLQYDRAFTSVSKLKTIRYTPGTTGVMPDRPDWDTTGSSTRYAPEYQSSKTLQEIIFEDGVIHIASYLCRVSSGGRDMLTSVIFPSTLESVGVYAFFGCSNATFSQWPQSLTYIGMYSFQNCDQLNTLPSTLTVFPESCFFHCDGLTEIILPDHTTKIDTLAFAMCSNAVSLTMPADLQYGKEAFRGTSLKTIRYTPGSTGVIPNRLPVSSDKTAAYAPEYQCSSTLKEIIFEEGIIHIASYLCQVSTGGSRTALTSVTLPSTLESIGAYTFSNCSSLDPITFPGDAPAIGSNAFLNVTTTGYYPQDNETWTEEIRQNYGGNIAWVPLSCANGHMEVTVKGTAPTCAQPGLTDGTRCSLCREFLTPQEEIPATGNHISDIAPAFTWDDSFACTAAFTCRNCAEQVITTCQVTSEVIPAEGAKPAQIVYTAAVILGETTYTNTKTVDAPVAEHTHTPADSWQYDQISHWKHCTGCDEKLESAKHTPGTDWICTVCGFHISIPPELNWFFKKLEDPDNTLWATGIFVKIMEQYG